MTEEIDSFNNLEHKMINEEYKTWRKNVPYLYDILLTHALNWPSLSIQWFPDSIRNESNNTTTQRLLLSTHTSNSDTEYIKIVSVTFPDEIIEGYEGYEGSGFDSIVGSKSGSIVGSKSGNNSKDINKDISNNSNKDITDNNTNINTNNNTNTNNTTTDGFLCYNKIKVVQQIPVIYEVNRTRYCPFASNIIAIRSDHPEIHIYDYTKYLSMCGESSGSWVGGNSSNSNNPYTNSNRGSNNPYTNSSTINNSNPTTNSSRGSNNPYTNSSTINNSNPTTNSSRGSNNPYTNSSTINTNNPTTNTTNTTTNTHTNPTLELKGHTGGGYGLCWNKIKNGELMSTGEDKLVCIFDINEEGKEVISKLEKHTSVVNDCTFNYFNGHVGCSVGDDRRVVIWDTRMYTCCMVVEKAHSSDIFCCDFSCSDENMVVTGGKDGSVKVWDIRNGKECLYTLVGHKKEVLQVQWSPHFGSVLASSSADRRVCIWDLSSGSVGGSVDSKDKDSISKDSKDGISKDNVSMDGPPELLFMHGGHTNSVCDFSFNPLEPWEIASVAEDNILQIWQKGQGVGLRE
ncbi:Chromatin assembly complex, subunit 3, variant 2 [Hamiltosporidium tvaerminnensis]|nr:Chromatin assembly complex, subunit 3 [Hamiltosporidium tvaerminnensis]KAK1348849.1 Chromatin assembly complex, subunit 3, variant 2 [Hamiltosporidium tvaerminnensis]